jgi:ferric-dicitrate binding protein FerR (iron transport regulator)
MPVPWLTVGQLLLGNLDTILNVVRPGFTRKKLDDAPDRTALLNQQIAELQAAAASNAEQVKQLATQLKELVAALAQSAAEASAERAARRRIVQLALAIAGLALVCSVVALWGVFGMQT